MSELRIGRFDMIELVNVNKTIKGNEVLKEVNINLDKEKIYGFYGPNGSGKTMLFRAILGLIHTDTGAVFVNGKMIGKDIDFPESVGVLLEGPSFFDHLTGYENIELITSVSNKNDEKKIRTCIEKVELDPDDKRKYRAYSLGMKQRLGIALAIYDAAKLIIFDEPTNALDEAGKGLVKDIIKELRNLGSTILLASHDKESIESLSDVVYLVSKGYIEKQGDDVDA